MSLSIYGLTVDNTVVEDGFVRLQLNVDTVDTIQAEDVVVRNVTVTDGSLFTIVNGEYVSICVFFFFFFFFFFF